jgi:hypothetical protein
VDRKDWDGTKGQQRGKGTKERRERKKEKRPRLDRGKIFWAEDLSI